MAGLSSIDVLLQGVHFRLGLAQSHALFQAGDGGDVVNGAVVAEERIGAA